ncbi:MAG TPA: hypothetical protein PKH77_00630 [Anaerolineae bacterium]|nr:hypothetical protein [Anaerolineae bacterium]
MKRSIQFILGLILAGLAFVGVVAFGFLMRPTTYDVAVVMADVPPYTQMTAEMVAVDTQSVSGAIADKYILAEEWQAMLAAGMVVAVEPLHTGEPLLRETIATGENAYKVRRLAVALTDPDLTVLAVPVDADTMPAIYAGDAVALFFSAGQLQVQEITTDVITVLPATVNAPPVLQQPIIREQAEAFTDTARLRLPLTKRIAEGLVYRLNRELIENPNYGAAGAENEPQYVEGAVTSIDVVVHVDVAEWVAYALAHGKVQLGVLPAVAIPQLQAGTLTESQGVTWSDVEEMFFAPRMQELQAEQQKALEGHQPTAATAQPVTPMVTPEAAPVDPAAVPAQP